MNCPECNSQVIVKNGSVHNKKQKYRCKDCGRQFVENPKNRNKPIPQTVIDLIEKLLLDPQVFIVKIKQMGDLS